MNYLKNINSENDKYSLILCEPDKINFEKDILNQNDYYFKYYKTGSEFFNSVVKFEDYEIQKAKNLINKLNKLFNLDLEIIKI